VCPRGDAASATVSSAALLIRPSDPSQRLFDKFAFTQQAGDEQQQQQQEHEQILQQAVEEMEEEKEEVGGVGGEEEKSAEASTFHKGAIEQEEVALGEECKREEEEDISMVLEEEEEEEEEEKEEKEAEEEEQRQLLFIRESRKRDMHSLSQASFFSQQEHQQQHQQQQQPQQQVHQQQEQRKLQRLNRGDGDFRPPLQFPSAHQGNSFSKAPLASSTLSKADLAGTVVVGQLDFKFIVVVSKGVLCCCDQHAVDERVRLEEMVVPNPLSTSSPSSSSSTSSSLQVCATDQCVPLGGAALDALRHRAEVFAQWGFKYEALPGKSSGNRANEEEEGRVRVLQVPVILNEPLTAQDLVEFAHSVALNISVPAGLCKPPAIPRILASQACRTAVRFGDVLSMPRCQDMIDKLAKTQLPFQCAHGRPSMAPLLDLRQIKQGSSTSGGNSNSNANKANSWAKGVGNTKPRFGSVKQELESMGLSEQMEEG